MRGPFGLASTFGSIKTCGLVRETNPRPPTSQKISCEKLSFSENKGTKDCKKVDHSE